MNWSKVQWFYVVCCLLVFVSIPLDFYVHEAGWAPIHLIEGIALAYFVVRDYRC